MSAQGGQLSSSWVNTELKYLFNSSALVKFLVTTSPFTYRAGTPLQSFRWPLMYENNPLAG